LIYSGFRINGPSFVQAVKVNRIPGKEPPHHERNSLFPALEKDMDVVRHQGPRIDLTFGNDDQFAKLFQKSMTIFVIAEDIGPIDPPYL